MGPQSGQPGQKILELSQFDLRACFAGSRPLNKNFQNEPASIEYLVLDDLLEILDLARREIIVEDHQIGFNLTNRSSDLARFTTSNEGAGVRSLTFLQSATYDLDIRADRKLAELI